jgi:hypothetical protein
VVLDDGPRTGIPEPAAPRATIDEWRVAATARRRATPAAPSAAGDGAGQPLVLHEFQQEFAAFALAMRHAGLPPGQP